MAHTQNSVNCQTSIPSFFIRLAMSYDGNFYAVRIVVLMRTYSVQNSTIHVHTNVFSKPYIVGTELSFGVCV